MEQQIVKHEAIPVIGMEDEQQRQRILQMASEVFGVKSASVEEGNLRIGYDPYEVTIDYVKQEIGSRGIEFRDPPQPARNPFRRFLDSLIASNERTYGSQRLDCCKLNRKD